MQLRIHSQGCSVIVELMKISTSPSCPGLRLWALTVSVLEESSDVLKVYSPARILHSDRRQKVCSVELTKGISATPLACSSFCFSGMWAFLSVLAGISFFDYDGKSLDPLYRWKWKQTLDLECWPEANFPRGVFKCLQGPSPSWVTDLSSIQILDHLLQETSPLGPHLFFNPPAYSPMFLYL